MRFLLESCLEIGLSAMITVLMMDSQKSFANFWEGVSTALAFISLLILLIAPFYQSIAIYQFIKDKRLAKEK